MLSLSIGKQNTADRISRESGMNCLFVFVRISPVITNSQPLLPKLSHLVPRDSWEPAFGIEKPSGTSNWQSSWQEYNPMMQAQHPG